MLMVGWTVSVTIPAVSIPCRAARAEQSPIEQLEVLGFDLNADGFARAVARKQRRLIDLFLRAKADPNIGDAAGRTPLLHAIAAGESNLVGLLLAAGADAGKCDANGVTPLMLAAQQGRIELLDTLLKKGVDLNATDHTGRAAIHYAIAAQQLTTVEKLLPQNPRLDGKACDGMDAFALAVDTRNWAYMQPILERFAPREWDFYGRSALQQAVSAGDVNRVRLVMSKHIGAPTPEDCNEPLLAYAVVANDLKLTRLLLDAGADPNTVCKAPAEPKFLEYVSAGFMKHYLTEEQGMNVLMIAAGIGNVDIVKLLLERGADRARPTDSKYKLVPLYFASWGEHAQCIQALISNAPSPEQVRIEVNLAIQKATLYRDGAPVFDTEISTGRKGFSTPTGQFVITDKKTTHMSSIYKVKMPFFMRLSCRDFGMHEGYVPDYPASHGCIRLPSDAARKLFKEVPIGTLVTITN
jgi:ankyrin repeat protein